MKTHAQGLLEDRRLDLMLRTDHELVRLTEAIGWVGGVVRGAVSGDDGAPRDSDPHEAVLVMFQHTFGLSDEQVVAEWPGIPDAGRKYESIR